MFIFYQPDLVNGLDHLDTEESRHCVKVLRLKEGDTIHITDGKGSLYESRILEASSKKCRFKLINQVKEKKRDYYIHIAIAPTKNVDRMEWFVEKSTEIGIDEITFLQCDNSERKVLKIERIEKKAISAMKQSLKFSLPKINPLIAIHKFLEIRDAIEQKFIAYVDDTLSLHLKNCVKPGSSYLILIGPEGDFSTAEINKAKENHFTPVNMGKARLRTETAGIVACHALNFINQ